MKIKVWDSVTRVFHLALISATALSLLSGFQDKFGVWGDIHYWSGITVFGLVVWRFFYGVFGSQPNRLTALLAGPGAVVAALRQLQSRTPANPPGHGAAGGWSVLFMLILLLAQSSLGLFSSDDMFFSGPLSRQADILPFAPLPLHESLAYAVMVWLGLHVVTVLAYRVWGRTDLIKPMIHGYKDAGTHAPPVLRPWYIGWVSLLGVVGAALWFLG